MKKILYLIATDNYFCSHRFNLGKASLKAGYEVALATACTPQTQHKNDIENAGIAVFPLQHFSRAGLNPIRQFRSLLELYRIYKKYKPDIVHQVAMKPVVFGSLIAYLCRVPKVINAVAGLGFLFTEKHPSEDNPKSIKKTILLKLLAPLFRIIFSRNNTALILQNEDDLNTLADSGFLKRSSYNFNNNTFIIRGAGIDPDAFQALGFATPPPIVIACVSRMLWSKGIGELINAAKIIKNYNINMDIDKTSTPKIKMQAVQILLYGMPDPENPASISSKQLQAWHDSGIIIWKKYCNNTAKAYADCHIAVLPSYREGLPKSLLEAACAGRPIVTTDVPGCREIVKDGENGILVPAKDCKALSDALLTLILNEDLRKQMGEAGRARVLKYFQDSCVIEQTLSLY